MTVVSQCRVHHFHKLIRKYFIDKDDTGHYKFNVERMERQLKDPKYTKRCKYCKTFSDNDRKTLFNQFWDNMDWIQKKEVTSMVDKVDVKESQKTAEET
jgi:hypothetical protein